MITFQTETFDKTPFTITIRAEEEDLPIRGNVFASDDPEADRACEDELIAEYARGGWHVWFCLVVEASIVVDGERIVSRQFLGGCSYEKNVNLREVAEEHGMIEEAHRDLVRHLTRIRDELNEVEL